MDFLNKVTDSISQYRKFAETKMINYLRLLTYFRSKLLLKLPWRVTTLLENSVVFHLSLIITVLIISISVFAKVRTITFFSLHPLFMSMAGLIFIGEAVVSYRNRFLLESFSDIMQKGKRTKPRALHQGLNICATIFFSLGLLAVWSNDIEHHKTLIPSALHPFLGTILLSFIIIQVIIGHRKLFELEGKTRGPKTIGLWHADHGLFLWDFIAITLITGAFKFLDIAGISLYICILSILIAWSSLHFQMKKSGPDTTQLNVFTSTFTPYEDPTTASQQTTGENKELLPSAAAPFLEEEFEL